MRVHSYLAGTGPAPEPVVRTDLPGVPLFARGKVREIYDLGDRLLLVASDRISAFDVVMNEPIPGKGIVLTSLSAFWFEATADLLANHYISVDPADFPAELRSYSEMLSGRAMLVKKAERIDIECVVRGYLAGSAWSEYEKDGTVAGVALPVGLRESDKLEKPIFTPATKAESGHDINISVDEMKKLAGVDLTETLVRKSIDLYNFAEQRARSRGIILADTKFEFGLIDGKATLIDEVFTPDSSRFWPADQYEPGRSQPSFDKQYLRDYLLSVGWNKEPPPPTLPAEVVAKTGEKYRDAYVRIVGRIPED
ncbi:MAG TPA: phosphoribosylaminoimidazolesuccinocarboxamide synthase [Chloroflexota bacterium]|nr:phosphoribosylaminoimidazolesuccinocarboxamide synthase [Chloroflexota bacterium]